MNIFGRKLLPGNFAVFSMTQGITIWLVWDFSCLWTAHRRDCRCNLCGSSSGSVIGSGGNPRLCKLSQSQGRFHSLHQHLLVLSGVRKAPPRRTGRALPTLTEQYQGAPCQLQGNIFLFSLLFAVLTVRSCIYPK